MATLGQTITPQVPGILANGAPFEGSTVIDAGMWSSFVSTTRNLETRIGTLETIAGPRSTSISPTWNKLFDDAKTLEARVSSIEQARRAPDGTNEKMMKMREDQAKLESWANKLQSRMVALEAGESECGPLLDEDLAQRSAELQGMEMETRNLLQRMEALQRPVQYGVVQGATSAENEAMKQEVESLRLQCEERDRLYKAVQDRLRNAETAMAAQTQEYSNLMQTYQALQVQCEASTTNRSSPRLQEQYQILKSQYERMENEASNRVSRAEYENLQQTCQALQKQYEAVKNGTNLRTEEEYQILKLECENLKNENSGRNQRMEEEYQTMKLQYERMKSEDINKVPRAEYDSLKLQLQDSVPREIYNALVAQSNLLIEPKIFDDLKKELEAARAEVEVCMQTDQQRIALIDERDTLKQKLEQSVSDCEELQAKVLGQVDPQELEALKKNLLALNTVQRTQEEQLRTSVTIAEYDALKQESKNQVAMYTQALQENAELKEKLQQSVERTEAVFEELRSAWITTGETQEPVQIITVEDQKTTVSREQCEALLKKYEKFPEEVSKRPASRERKSTSQAQLFPATQSPTFKVAQVLTSPPMNVRKTPSHPGPVAMRTTSERSTPAVAAPSVLPMYGSVASTAGTFSTGGSLTVITAKPSSITSMGAVPTTYWTGDAVMGNVTDKLTTSYDPSKIVPTKSASPPPQPTQAFSAPSKIRPAALLGGGIPPGMQTASHQQAYRPMMPSGPSRKRVS